jgi:hypothetical protein
MLFHFLAMLRLKRQTSRAHLDLSRRCDRAGNLPCRGVRHKVRSIGSPVLTGGETDVKPESVLEVPKDFKDAFDKDPE